MKRIVLLMACLMMWIVGCNGKEATRKKEEAAPFSIQKPWQVQINIPKEKLPKNGVLMMIVDMKDASGHTVQKEYVLQQFH